MEAAVKQRLSYPASEMNIKQKKMMALQVVRGTHSVANIAKENQVSRQFVYKQKHKAISAIEEAFSSAEHDDEVLYNLPITKSWIKQCITSLTLDCHSSFRGASKFCESLLDYSISIGSIYNVMRTNITKAQQINDQEDLSNIELSAHDELFHHNKPVLAGVDIQSLYCYLLSQENHRDGETWAIHLWDLEKKGFNPERVIADNGDGLRAGHKIALPHIPCDADNFHITKTLIELRRYFRNSLKTAISYQNQQENKMAKERTKTLGQHQKYSHKLGLARKYEKKMQYLSTTIDTLVSWMEHDILNKAGPDPAIRYELFDFVVSEFKKLEKLEKLYPHRIRSVRITLKNQRNLLLAFSEVLDNKFEKIAERFSCSLETVWKICELQRCDHNSMSYAVRRVPLILSFGNSLDDNLDNIEDAVIDAMNQTERTSSMIENFNSRLSPYFFLRREIGYGYLNLLRFYLNHTPFLRSEKQHRLGKTPTEILTGKPCQHWLEMLGFEKFKRAA